MQPLTSEQGPCFDKTWFSYCRYDNSSLASGSQEFNRRISDITHDIQALGFQDTHGDIEEEDYYL